MRFSPREARETDYRIRATWADGALRAVAVITTEAARAAQRVHRASPVAAAAMGRALSAAALLGADVKEAFRLEVQLDGDGPLGLVAAEIRQVGGEQWVRARVQHPEVDLPLRSDGKLAVGQAIGRQGAFRVWFEDAGGARYQSEVPLVTGEIGEDLAHYYWQSVQVPSAVAVGVLVGTDGTVTASGGVVVQALPGSEAEREAVAERFLGLQHLSHRIAEGATGEDLIRSVLPEPIHWLEREPLRFRCQCSRRRSLALLAHLPPEELQALAHEQHGAEVTCHYCRRRYRFSEAELEALWREGANRSQ
ncbi:MAG: Hsp33 family molecular chaperone HslO [Firmicutes bacterium]|nr:Hsp33 family molecular chaperone HslO [Alicyclobacillaceae bacterium]MCL6496428.1 Hsp33 family molecular chaperone HslO [Bacillota bacterium]